MKLDSHTPERLYELDALRGLTALAVVFFHYTSIYTEDYAPVEPPLFNFPWGAYGVHLFFLISGFVIFMTLEKTARPLDFVVSRFSRLFPAYWSAVLITFIIVNSSSFTSLKVPWKHAVFNLTMVQDWFHLSRVDGVYWTLTIELSFYLFMLFLFLTRSLKHIETLGVMWLVLMMLDAVVMPMLPVHVPGIIGVTNLLKFGHLFFAGILFYNLRTKGHTWQRYALLGLCWGVQFLQAEPVNSGLPVLMVFILFYLFATQRLAWLAQKPLIYLGAISYTLYLTHQYIGYVIIDYLFTLHANAWLRFIIPLISALAIASAITFLVEKPAMGYMRIKYRDWQGGRSAQK